MTARDQMRAMLEQLMGSDTGSAKSNMSFEDRRVCRPFLLSCCPHEALMGTRVDMGECPKIHDYALRADYERAAATRALNYEYDALDVLTQFIAECDRKTEYAKRKLRETQEELGEEAARKMNSIHDLGEQIGTKLAKAEELGAQGMVDESMKLLEEVERLRQAKADAEQEFRATMPASTYQQQKLRVCEVCSAYLGIHDNDRRLADHFGGKLHLGFIQIREKLDELKQRVNELNEKRELERKNRRSPPSSKYERDGEDRDRDRNRDRDRDQHDRRRSHRSRSDSRSRKVSSRDRDRSRRSRSRSDRRSSKHSRYHRSSRSNSRSRKHGKRSRSRSGSSHRDRRRHSRSRSRGSSSRQHHSSSKSKSNGDRDEQSSRHHQKSYESTASKKPSEQSNNSHVTAENDDDETIRILENIQRSMKEEEKVSAME